jgi:hypothetical protein
LTEANPRVASQFEKLKPVADDAPEPQRKSVPISRQLSQQPTEVPVRLASQYETHSVQEDVVNPIAANAPPSRQVTRQLTRQLTQQLTREPTESPSCAASQCEIFESTKPELESFDLNSREELQDGLVEAIEQLETTDSKAEIDELKAEIAHLVEQLETAPEAQS